MITTAPERPITRPDHSPVCAPDRSRILEYDTLVRRLLEVHELAAITDEQRKALVDAANRIQWDDAIHVAAPWEIRSSLCGLWDRNLVALDADLPDGMAGCWSCLQAADWLSARLGDDPPVSVAPGADQQETT